MNLTAEEVSNIPINKAWTLNGIYRVQDRIQDRCIFLIQETRTSRSGITHFMQVIAVPPDPAEAFDATLTVCCALGRRPSRDYRVAVRGAGINAGQELAEQIEDAVGMPIRWVEIR